MATAAAAVSAHCVSSSRPNRCPQQQARATLKTSSFVPRLAARSAATRRSTISRVVQSFRDTENIQDWRIKQMVELAHSYLIDYLTNKKAELAETLFDDQIVHKDVVWDPTHPTVGVDGMKHYLADLSTAFPDFWVEVEQYATVDTNSIMVTYNGSATNLGEYHHHKPTHHASTFQGCNTFKFNHDRSRITEIQVYRSAFAEDIDEVGERRLAEEGGFRELRIKRLV